MTNALFIMAHPECTAGMRREGKAIWRGRGNRSENRKGLPLLFFLQHHLEPV